MTIENNTLAGILPGHEIDTPEQSLADLRTPYNKTYFEPIGITRVWEKYDGILSWGEGQTLAILDDGCDLNVPEWQTVHPWGPKVRAAWNAFEQNNDPTPVPPGYHGTSVGHPFAIAVFAALPIATKPSTSVPVPSYICRKFPGKM